MSDTTTAVLLTVFIVSFTFAFVLSWLEKLIYKNEDIETTPTESCLWAIVLTLSVIACLVTGPWAAINIIWKVLG